MLLKNLFKVISAGLAGLGIGMAFAPKDAATDPLIDSSNDIDESKQKSSSEKFYNIKFEEAPPPPKKMI